MHGSALCSGGEAVSYSPMVLSPEVCPGEGTNPRWTATGYSQPICPRRHCGSVVDMPAEAHKFLRS